MSSLFAFKVDSGLSSSNTFAIEMPCRKPMNASVSAIGMSFKNNS